MRRILTLLVGAILLATATARAQDATVNVNTPIYVKPSPPAGTLPLRVAAAGTILKVVGEEGEWLQVQFKDPQWGVRTGWVSAVSVTVSRPELQPMDLSVRPVAPASAPGRAGSTLEESAGQQVPASTKRPQVRDGFWFNVGLGYGGLGCEDCSGRESGLSGGLAAGGTLGDKWLLGVGTTGWAKDLDGELLTVGTLDGRFRFYPVRTSGFFVTGGLGLGTLSYAGETEVGVGVVLGLGWDIRVGRNVSLTPFWNGFAMRNSVADANVGQLGLGVTLH